MVTRHERGNVIWVDLEAPTNEELRAVMTEFSIDPHIEGEIISPTPYPLMMSFPDYAYLILHFPTADVKGGARNQELDIIAGRNFLITVRYEVVSSILALHKGFEAEELLGLPSDNAGPALVERILRRLYIAMTEEIDRAARKLDRIEADIFSGKERQTVRAISEIGRVLLRFDTTLTRHAEPLSEFLAELSTPSFYGKAFTPLASRIHTEREHVASLVASYRAVIGELRTTNDSLLSSSQNEVMKIFTLMTVAFLPLTLIAAVFGMHAKNAPILGHPHDFALILVLMVVVELLLVLFLRFKKWL